MAILFVVAAVFVVVMVMRFEPKDEVLPETKLTAPVAPVAESARSAPQVAFTDITEQSGVAFQHRNGATGQRFLPETMGGGVAVFDYNGDGAQDLLFVGSSSWDQQALSAPERNSSLVLYENNGEGQFTDVTAAAGLEVICYCMGVSVGDVNADARLDIYVTALGKNFLFLNSTEGFVRQPDALGAAGELGAWSTSATFVDYDQDGWLDLFVANYVQWTPEIDLEVDYQLAGIGRAYGPPTQYPGSNSYLFRNVEGTRFEDVSSTSGIPVYDEGGRPIGKGLGVLAWDWDGDLDQDLFLANDTTRNFAFQNLGGGRFEEVASGSGVAFDNAGKATGAMGVDFLDQAGVLSIAVANFANEMTSFYVRPPEENFFTDEAVVVGVGPATRRVLSFGLFFFDYDLDGLSDLFQANGHVEPLINEVQPSQNYAQAPQLFWQCGASCGRQFVAVSAAGDLFEPMAARGAAYGDLDGDGDLDLVIVQVGAEARLFRNDQALGHSWLSLELRQDTPNVFAYGAKLAVVSDTRAQSFWVSPARSYLSHVPLPQTVGLGASDAPVDVEVTWPDGGVQTFPALTPNRHHVLQRRPNR